ncbi:MAG: DNA mismatch repair endonuclease MutL, partial [Planctomycetaceae bacterium]|nr:DNA mismatch repair endonuclease MutL [Planctomycetaceae bacterium]
MTNTRIIRSLSQNMINKIAAGEVVERPASVIKELMENSVDAESKHIEVIFEQAGMSLMKVIDDGVGITSDQLLSAIKPHATSKISDTDDLFKINTFGFRGEALASIAEISQLTLKSCAVGQDSGAMITCSGGEHTDPVPCGMPTGTQIEVRNLFFNTPVRRNYMRSAGTENSHISETFIRLAIPHPEIHFVLKNNGKVVYDLPADPNVLTRIKLIFGENVSKGLIHIEGQPKDKIRIEGYVSLPSHCRINNKFQYIFLNGRYIRDRALQRALIQSYQGVIMPKLQPSAFLNITMPPEMFDVNVHPMKLEVRFLDSSRIYSGLLGAVREKFMTTDLKERVDLNTTKPIATNQNDSDDDSQYPIYDGPQTAMDQNLAEQRRNEIARNFGGSNVRTGTSDSWGKPNGNRSGSTYGGRSPASSKRTSSSWDDFDDSSATGRDYVGGVAGDSGQSNTLVGADDLDSSKNYVPPSGLGDRVAYSPKGRVVVQMHNRYLVMETAEGIAIIDQHALHERILYERLKNLMGGIVGGGKLEAQGLLEPIPVDLNPAEFAVVMDNIQLLNNLGLRVESFGGNTVIISSLPSIIYGVSAEDILTSLIEPLLDNGMQPDPMALLDEMLHSMACKAAIKAGDKMRPDAIAELIAQAESEINSH